MVRISRQRSRSLGILGLALGLCAPLAACGDDPGPGKLFEEEGVWSVITYDLDGSGELRDIDTMNRRDAFMLSFDTDNQVVTTASCVETENDTPASSTCLLTPDTTQWLCQCYAYDFEDNQMLWSEFDAGDIPPEVDLSTVDPENPDTELGTQITVAEIPDINSTYNFLPLPMGLFGSNGTNSRYIFQRRAASVFERAYTDERRPTCEPCLTEMQ